MLAFAQLSGPAEIRDVDRVLAEGAVVPAARGRGFGVTKSGPAIAGAAATTSANVVIKIFMAIS